MKSMTNYEHIKAMSMNEMFRWIFRTNKCENCLYRDDKTRIIALGQFRCLHNCKDGITGWLESEVKYV